MGKKKSSQKSVGKGSSSSIVSVTLTPSSKTPSDLMEYVIRQIEESVLMHLSKKYRKSQKSGVVQDKTLLDSQILQAFSDKQNSRRELYDDLHALISGICPTNDSAERLEVEILKGLLLLLEDQVYRTNKKEEWQKKYEELTKLMIKVEQHDLVHIVNPNALTLYDEVDFQCHHGRIYKKCIQKKVLLEKYLHLKERLAASHNTTADSEELKNLPKLETELRRRPRVDPNNARLSDFCEQRPFFYRTPQPRTWGEPPIHPLPQKKRGTPPSLTTCLFKEVGTPLHNAGCTQRQLCEFVEKAIALLFGEKPPTLMSLERQFLRFKQN